MSTKILGHYGEELAWRFLQEKGYKILEKNFRNKLGEIDLIVQQDKTVCFVEVKTRRSFQYGAPFEAVHATKQHKMVQMALCYLKYKFRTIDIPSRFDVISIRHSPKKAPMIEHIVNAFDLTYLSH